MQSQGISISNSKYTCTCCNKTDDWYNVKDHAANPKHKRASQELIPSESTDEERDYWRDAGMRGAWAAVFDAADEAFQSEVLEEPTEPASEMKRPSEQWTPPVLPEANVDVPVCIRHESEAPNFDEAFPEDQIHT